MAELLNLAEAEVARSPAERRILRGAIGTAIVLHAIVLAVLVWRPHTTAQRVTVAHQGSIAAYVNVMPAPAGTSGAAKPVIKPRPVSLAPARANVPDPRPASNESPGPGQDVAVAAGAQGGPARISPGQIQLVNKVDPVYPQLMLAAKRTGTVVLDATIRPDGTIDDVKVLQSLGSLFDRAAIDAVKQWRYTPPGFEAVLTVTVIFSIK